MENKVNSFMGIPNNILTKYPEIDSHSILLGYRGSIAHGTHLPKKDPFSVDDIDIIGICIPPIDCYFGLKEFYSKGTREIMEGEYDIVLFELRKAIRLLEEGNPNVLSILWLQPNHYLKITEVGKLLLENKNLFVGKHVYHSFVGYAHGQLHRMTHPACKGHMGEKRKKLVEKFGFDVKNSAHCIRLLRMGIEFLTDGELHVLRQDAQQLLEIRKGEWTLEQVQKEADRLFKLSDEAFIHSKLPDKPDHKKINDLCVEMITEYFRKECKNE